MVNTSMFKDAFRLPSDGPAPQPIPQAAPVPQPLPKPQAPEDPDVAKLKFLMLKWLSIIIGGSAALLIVWRVALKFF